MTEPAALQPKKVLVVGDVMLDRYIFGETERISDEAPVPVVRVLGEKCLPGGAGNVAANIASLGGEAVLIGAIGDDSSGAILRQELRKRLVVFYKFLSQTTTQKIRLLSRGQQLIRIDYESTKNLSSPEKLRELKKILLQKGKKLDIIVISDYAKGMISRPIASFIMRFARQNKKPVIVDTKPGHAPFFKGADLFTPNSKEAIAMSGEKNIMRAGRVLQKKLKSNILITEGPKGMTLFEGNSITHLPTQAREVFDVTGAGDTVVAALALTMASGLSLKEAANIANRAAGIVVGKVGTATVSLAELYSALS